MAKSIIVQTEDAVDVALLTAIADLAKGRLMSLIEMSLPFSNQFRNTDLCSQAARTRYYLLLQGVLLLAAIM
ncbi:MAG: hypothetical protein HOP02_03275 [Methylococcaceae bacterium]|nr:hypothetical protein [Methylococcaceae bacterium]